jgi:hypothetical protein
MNWIKDSAITRRKTATMEKKMTRVRKRAERVERPFFSNQWRSIPKIRVRKIEKKSGPRTGDAAFIPAKSTIAAARGMRIPDSRGCDRVEFIGS